ncbi:helicase-related protein [Puia dinghuensis]|uniref:Helicase ATP-binding domain-containing protein n=1 Tax=Puia dinghuensis TaxID=1792502 RepID=A0A8J2UBM0_9BACT|nr:helicase-related protein [Puia dinghuensis]GGA92786.1 hypothetical protein GCM10011511_15240 [Puia dinghuensis]
MKYKPQTGPVTAEARKETDHRIVNLIRHGITQDLDPEKVFSEFTGKGGLHGLEMKNFDSFHAYTEAKKEIEQGQFFTPDSLCASIVTALKPPDSLKIADITCGKGSFFNHLPIESQIYGNELDEDAFEVCRYCFPQAQLENKDFLNYNPGLFLDLIIGNPPFNIRTDQGTSQFAFLKKAHQLLQYGGVLAFIVPDSFLADSFQDGQKIEWVNRHFNFVLQCELPAGSFDAVIDTKFMVFQKMGVANAPDSYTPDQWTDFDPESIQAKIMAPLFEKYLANRVKNRSKQAADNAGIKDVDYCIRRRLWHIQENKRLYQQHYRPVRIMLYELKTQQKPKDMDWESWDAKKMTPEKILAYLEKAVRNQQPPRVQWKVKTVKTQYGFKEKAYHPKLLKNQSYQSIHDVLASERIIPGFSRLIARKRKKLALQNAYFTEMARSPEIDHFLNTVTLQPPYQPGLLFQPDDIPIIVPNTMQKLDLGLIFQKPYGLLSWEQGGGKSVAGMLWIKYLQGKVKNFFVLGPALAITATWADRLAKYGFDFTILKKIGDIDRIRPGQIVLVSYDQLVTLERHIRKFVKRCSYKIALLVDESDELTNPHSQRSHAALNSFRKAKYKLLTTGTTTRNSINEIFTQLELLYNNSSAFLCQAPIVYHIDQEGHIQARKNERQGEPFPPHVGSALFRSCFCPLKSTVFGIQKDNQDVYNEEILKELINKTVITRKFEEIVGEKKYSIHVHHIKQNDAEKSLYTLLMKDFLKVCYDYYTRTGSERKEAGLRLVRQMMVLIKATSIPHKMKNYPGTTLPNKFQEIAALVNQWPNEYVTIGTTLKETADLYVKFLMVKFPNRKIFYIDGEMSVAARQKTLLQFKLSKNGILVATQQSLKSSVNIPFCNKCIIESHQWNIPKESQFYFRFIRFDSAGHTEIHYVNYWNTIEMNLTALLMAKEQLNDFIKTTNRTTTSDIYEEFGFDLNILDMLIQKNFDEKGNLYLTWGQQRLAA